MLVTAANTDASVRRAQFISFLCSFDSSYVSLLSFSLRSPSFLGGPQPARPQQGCCLVGAAVARGLCACVGVALQPWAMTSPNVVRTDTHHSGKCYRLCFGGVLECVTSAPVRSSGCKCSRLVCWESRGQRLDRKACSRRTTRCKHTICGSANSPGRMC